MYSANVLDELPVISVLRRYILYVPRSTASLIFFNGVLLYISSIDHF